MQMECSVEWVKRNTCWFGHTERLKNEEIVKKMHMSEFEGANRRSSQVDHLEDGKEVEVIQLRPFPYVVLPEGTGHQSY